MTAPAGNGVPPPDSIPPGQVPDIRTEFAIGALFLSHMPGDAPDVPEWRDTAVLGIRIRVARFPFPDEALARRAWDGFVSRFASSGMAVTAASGTGGFEGPIMVLKEPDAEEILMGTDRDRMKSRHQAMIRTDMEAARRFSRISGFRVKYRYSSELVQAPLPQEERVLNLFNGVRAPGNYGQFTLSTQELFGIHLWSDDGVRKVHGPVHGRGRLITAEGLPVFQMVGSNAYQLCLLLSEDGNRLERTRLWDGMYGILARGLSEPEDPPPDEDPADAVRAMVGRRRERTHDKVQRLDEEIRYLERQFTQKLIERTTEASALRALTEEAKDMAARAAADVAKIQALRGVTRVSVRGEDGLLVETDPVTLEHGGRRYVLGPFMINIDPDAQVAVWDEAPRHPEGHHHPHIDRTSLQCLGNITLPVQKLAAAYRFEEAVMLLLRWLRSYRPETTLIPIEGFPSEPIGPKPKLPKAERKGP